MLELVELARSGAVADLDQCRQWQQLTLGVFHVVIVQPVRVVAVRPFDLGDHLVAASVDGETVDLAFAEQAGQALVKRVIGEQIGMLADAGNTTTLANYLNLLNDAGLLGGLEKYSPNMVRKRSSSPKFMVHNTAIMSGISNESMDTLLADPKAWGRWVESAVGAHLINQSFKDKKLNVYYWREGNEEVDFVLEYKKRVIALEVKSSKTGTLSGMNAFAKQFKPEKTMLIGAEGIPWQEFLQMDVLDLYA